MAICWCSIFAYFGATIAKSSSCNRDSMAHKAYHVYYLALWKNCLLTPVLKGQSHRANWQLDNTSQLGEKWGVTGGEGNTEGMLRGGWGGRCAGREPEADTDRGAGRQDHLRGGSGLWREHIPSFEIISRNLQTWVQVLARLKQFLKLLLGFVCPDGPESLERRY